MDNTILIFQVKIILTYVLEYDLIVDNLWVISNHYIRSVCHEKEKV